MGMGDGGGGGGPWKKLSSPTLLPPQQMRPGPTLTAGETLARSRRGRRGRRGGRARGAPDLLSLLDLGQHDDGVALPLPDHPPEVLHRVCQRPLGGDEVVLLPVALRGKQRLEPTAFDPASPEGGVGTARGWKRAGFLQASRSRA